MTKSSGGSAVASPCARALRYSTVKSRSLLASEVEGETITTMESVTRTVEYEDGQAGVGRRITCRMLLLRLLLGRLTLAFVGTKQQYLSFCLQSKLASTRVVPA